MRRPSKPPIKQDVKLCQTDGRAQYQYGYLVLYDDHFAGGSVHTPHRGNRRIRQKEAVDSRCFGTGNRLVHHRDYTQMDSLQVPGEMNILVEEMGSKMVLKGDSTLLRVDLLGYSHRTYNEDKSCTIMDGARNANQAL